MLYLYGIVDCRQPPELMPLGFEERAPDIAPYDGFAAVTGYLRQGRPPADEVHLRKHHWVLDAFMARCTVLPARFGSTFAGLEELNAYLASRRSAHAGDLQRLRGQIELGVRVARLAAPRRDSDAVAGASAAGSGPGARYLIQKHSNSAHRLMRQREAQDLASITSASLAPHATQVEWRALPASSEKVEVSMAFLLSRERLGAFREALAALRLCEPNLDILCTGPWPPYSFVSALDQAGWLPGKSSGSFQCKA